MTPFRRAALQLLGGALIISTSAPWARVAEVPPTISAFYRLAIGGAVMMGIVLWQRRIRYRPRDVMWMLLPALLFALDMATWHHSIFYVGPGLATVLANFQVFVMTLFGILLYRERPGWLFFGGVLLALSGIFLLVGIDWSGLSVQYRRGVWLGLVTAACYAGFILTMQHGQRRADSLSPMEALALMSLLCAVMLAGFGLAEGSSFAIPNTKTLVVLLIYGVFCQVIGWVLITRAIPVLPAFLIGLLLLIQPASSFLWDVIFFNRPTGMMDALGVVLVLIGIYLASARARTRA